MVDVSAPIVVEGIDAAAFEALAIAGEECGEVVQRIGKILRFGMRASPYTGRHNRDTLEAELGDVLAAISLLEANGVVSIERVAGHASSKIAAFAVPDGRLRHARLPGAPRDAAPEITDEPTNPDALVPDCDDEYGASEFETRS